MIRTVITADKNFLTLNIPDDYVGKQIEVIAFALDEGQSVETPEKKEVSFDAMKLDTRGFKFNRKVKVINPFL